MALKGQVMFEMRPTTLGISYSFNAYEFERQFNMTTKFATSFKNGVLIKNNWTRNEIINFTIDNRLMLILRTKPQDNPIRFELHDPRFPSNVLANGIEVKQGKRTVVQVVPSQKVGLDALQNIPLEKRQCKFPFETNGLQLFSEYSTSGCLMECMLKKLKNHCGCIPFDFPQFDDDYELCDFGGNYCFDFWLQNEGKNIQHECKHCVDNCLETKYGFSSVEYALVPEEVCSMLKNFELIQLIWQFPEEFLDWKLESEQIIHASNETIKFEQDFCRSLSRHFIVLEIDIPNFVDQVTQFKKDQRMKFQDQLANFGKSSVFILIF